MKNILNKIKPAPKVSAHCDGPCGVYDPAQARVSAEAVLSMTQKMLDLPVPTSTNAKEMAHYSNTMARYAMIKEDEAEKAKHHLLVLWTDFFKPEHLEQFPDLHETFWKAAKECSSAKQEVSLEHAQQLMAYVEEIHNIFWRAKGRDVKWELANG